MHPNIESIRSLIPLGSPGRRFVTQISERGREPKGHETPIDDAVACGLSKAEAIKLFRALENAGCGEFRVGRRSKKTRIVWSQSAITLAKEVLTGGADDHRSHQATADKAPSARSPAIVQSSGTAMAHVHHFLLRPNCEIRFELPLDLTDEEAMRLTEFIRALPFRASTFEIPRN